MFAVCLIFAARAEAARSEGCNYQTSNMDFGLRMPEKESSLPAGILQ
jgi:hypothetical protein